MQSWGNPTLRHRGNWILPFAHQRNARNALDDPTDDSNFSNLVTAIRLQCLTVRGSTEESPCSLRGDPHPLHHFHLPNGADLHCVCLGLSNPVHNNASCDVLVNSEPNWAWNPAILQNLMLCQWHLPFTTIGRPLQWAAEDPRCVVCSRFQLGAWYHSSAISSSRGPSMHVQGLPSDQIHWAEYLEYAAGPLPSGSVQNTSFYHCRLSRTPVTLPRQQSIWDQGLPQQSQSQCGSNLPEPSILMSVPCYENDILKNPSFRQELSKSFLKNSLEYTRWTFEVSAMNSWKNADELSQVSLINCSGPCSFVTNRGTGIVYMFR